MRTTAFVGLVVGLVLSAPSAIGATAAEPIQAGIAGGRLEVALRAAPFTLERTGEGQRIRMEGYGDLKEPGRPMLPEKELLLLLPPGARALAVEAVEVRSKTLPGRYEIAPAPPMLPLADSPDAGDTLKEIMERWEAARRAAYAADEAYPGEVVRIAGSGTLRKYAYVSLAFRPFTYHAPSGRLTYHESARVRVRYALPEPGSAEASLADLLLSDTAADAEAARLFANFDEMSALYAPPPGAPPATAGTTQHYDYVVVTTPGLVDAFNASDFPAWKASLGFDLRIVTTADPEITGQPGWDLAERIRNFLRANYGAWGIEHVLLVGGIADVPMRYCFPDPQNHLHDPADPGTGPGSVPTDAYYADLSLPDADSWDLDGDGFYGEYGEDTPDFLADVAVGRIPTGDPARVTYTLNKLVRYEQDTGPWKRNALHAGAILFYENQDDSGIPLRDGAVFVNEVETHFMQGWTVSRYSEREGLVPSPFPWPALTLQSFTLDWNAGMYGIVNWAGHGWPDSVARVIWRWDDGDGIPETDGSDGMDSESFITDFPLYEDDYPSILCAVSCNVGYPEPNAYGNLGIHLLTDPAMGAAAGVVSSSRYAAVSRDWPAQPGGAESLCYEFNRYLIAGPGGPRTLGRAVLDAKFYSHVHYGWDSDYEYRDLYDYNLYGDPAMDWRGAGTRTGNLLRSTEVQGLDPVTPALDNILPLDPVDDLYIPNFVAGDVDPDPAAGCPLVFYAVDGPVWLWLGKAPTGEVRIDF